MKLSHLLLPLGLVAASSSALAAIPSSWENTLDGWEIEGNHAYSSSFSTTIGVTAGTTALVVGNMPGTAANGNSNNSFLQTFDGSFKSLVAGGATELSFDITPINFVNASGVGGLYFIAQVALNTEFGGFRTVAQSNLNLGDTTRVTYTLSASDVTDINLSSYAGIHLSYGHGGYDGGSIEADTGAYVVDDFRIETAAIPEPASAASLLGLGALGLVALRRRSR